VHQVGFSLNENNSCFILLNIFIKIKINAIKNSPELKTSVVFVKLAYHIFS